MKRLVTFLGLLFLLSMGYSHAQELSRILFIGNSFTYVNNLPELFQGLAHSSTTPVALETVMFARPAATLQGHWSAGQAVTEIRKGGWDYVVLHEQSSLGSHSINGKRAINDPALFHRFARLFHQEITAVGAKTVFWLTWAHRDYPQEQPLLTYAYMSIAKELQAIVAPVGLAWQQVLSTHPTLELYHRDGSHPRPLGSYLIASTVFATLFGRSPVGSRLHIEGHPVRAGRVQDKVTTLVKLSTSEASLLQGVALETVQQLQKAGGYLGLERPSFPQPPTLPKGRILDAGRLVGTWRGSIHFFRQPGSINCASNSETTSGRGNGPFPSMRAR